MTVSSVIPVNNYTGNNSNKKFDFDFLIEKEEELVVTYILEDKTEIILENGIDYEINSIGNANGSYITFPIEGSSYDVLKSGETISLALNLTIEQESEFENSSHLNLKLLEWTFDYIVRILQIFSRKIQRSIKTQEGFDVDTDKLVRNVNTVADCVDNIEAVVDNEDNIETVVGALDEITAVSNSINNVNAVAGDLTNINNASLYANNANIWAEGTDEQVQELGGVHSAKEWSRYSSTVSNGDVKAISANKNTGSVIESSTSDSTQAAYSDVLYYAHSSFDLSKFTVTGTPTVTDDGIFSNSSGSAAAAKSTNSYNMSGVIHVEFLSPYIKNQSSLATNIFVTKYGSASTGGFVLGNYANGKFQINYNYTGGTGGNVQGEWTVGKWYQIKYDINGTTLKLYQREKGSDWTLLKTVENVTPSTSNEAISVAEYNQSDGRTLVDMKGCSLKFDGVLVFSGNKTSVDTIKPSNYTVVGTPTISADGVASGLSNNNYITVPSSFLTANSWKIEYPISATQTNQAGIIAILTDSCLQIVYTPTNKQINYALSSNGSSWDIGSSVFVASTLDNTKDSIFVIEFTGTKYEMYFIQNGIKINGEALTSSSKLYASSNKLTLGNNRSLYSPINGSIDLNAFKIYVDGNLIYQPCLKIPYTLSKTGSKVVDVYARPRVQDMYEQFGYAPYYTIDETNKNFTLPMGEMYGMMLNQSTPHLIETYVNGTDWYRVYSGGWCEQGGIGTENTEIALFKSYKNTNYGIQLTPAIKTITNPASVVAADKTVSSFKFAIAGDDVGTGTAYWITWGRVF